MAINEFQIHFHNKSNLPRDDAVITLFFEINSPDTHQANAADLAVLLTSFGASSLNDSYANGTIKVYDEGPGPPKQSLPFLYEPIGPATPTEVALCLSYSADDGQAGTPRRRGRVYLPVTVAGNRPGAIIIDQVLDLGEQFAQIGTAGNTTWKLRSKANNNYLTIESISCDNEWDTQRRRGMRANSRERRDVQ